MNRLSRRLVIKASGAAAAPVVPAVHAPTEGHGAGATPLGDCTNSSSGEQLAIVGDAAKGLQSCNNAADQVGRARRLRSRILRDNTRITSPLS